MTTTAEMTPREAQAELARDIGGFYADPLGFVMYAYPWATDPEIQVVELQEPYASRYNCKYGPDEWACRVLDQIGKEVRKRAATGLKTVSPLQFAIASGHGIGKSAMVGWLVNWIMSTRPHAMGTLTANTGAQLETKTWAQVAKWTKKCVTRHWFDVHTGRGSMKMSQKDTPESWMCSAQTCREENSEAFAGQHQATSTSFYILDEASAVPNKIWEVINGGLTDGEPMVFAFGNPTRNDGKFRDCFKSLRHRWITEQIDSRTVQITNKSLFDEWIQDYGEDSDFVRVRVKGKFPRASSMQLIPSDVVERARNKEYHISSFDHASRIIGVDVARFGDDRSVITRRQGVFAKWPQKVYRETDAVTLANIINHEANEWDADGIIVDMGNIGAAIYDILVKTIKRTDVFGVWFGSESSRNDCHNKRADMWVSMLDWLKQGGAIEDSQELEDDLTAPEYMFDARDRKQLESKEDMKKRDLPSPDRGDSLAVTFAIQINKKVPTFRYEEPRTGKEDAAPDYNYLHDD
jgi:hypothetical protein